MIVSTLGYYLFIGVANDVLIESSYLLGTLLSFILIKNPKVNDKKLIYINDNIDKLSIKNVFDILGVNVDDYSIWIDNCVDILKKVLGEMDEQDYMYSGSNRSR